MKKLIIALTFSISTLVFAKNDDGETRTATVKTTVSISDEINIQAKNTELQIEAWDKNEVEIEASIRFEGKMTNKMQAFLDEFEERVKSKISSGAGQLKIDTDLDIPNRIQIGGNNVGINISYGDKDLTLVYKIKAPGSNDYIINNSYEDVSLIGDYDNVDFTQYSGELDAGSIRSGKLSMKYGSATIENLGDVEMKLYEQKMDIGTLGNVELDAKYSEFDLGKVGKIVATSYESDFEINSIDQMQGNFKYGKINISDQLAEAKFVFYEMGIEANKIGTLRMENSKYSKFEFDQAGTILFEQSYEDDTDIEIINKFKSENSKYGNHSIELLEGSFVLNGYEDETEIDGLGTSVSEISISGKYLDNSIDIGNTAFILLTDIKYGKADYNESEVDLRRYIKENDQLELEIHSKTMTSTPARITIKGYEVDVILN